MARVNLVTAEYNDHGIFLKGGSKGEVGIFAAEFLRQSGHTLEIFSTDDEECATILLPPRFSKTTVAAVYHQLVEAFREEGFYVNPDPLAMYVIH